MVGNGTIPESLLRQSYAFDRLGASAVVLDGAGVIVETNEAWRLFAALNDASPGATGLGISYLRVCDQAFDAGSAIGGAVAQGLREILSGSRASFEVEYPCPSPIEDRWFLLRASSAPVQDGVGAVVSHADISARKLLEEGASSSDRGPSTGRHGYRRGMGLIQGALAIAERDSTRVTVIRLSVVGLAAIEAEFGLPTSDQLVTQVAARARRAVRIDDEIGRLDADTLIVVCANLDDDTADSVVRRLEDACASPFQLGANQVALSIDVGRAVNQPGSTAIGLLAAATADEAPDVRAARIAQQRVRAAARPPNDIPAAPAPSSENETILSMTIARAQRDAVLANSNDLVLYIEPDGTIAWASPSIKTVLGVDPESLVGRSGFEMIHPEDQERALAALGSIGSLGAHARSEHRIVTDDGTIHWVDETVTNLVDDPHVGYIVANFRVITERKRLELNLWQQANHDSLTGLANRTRLLAEIDAAIASDGRADEVGVIVFDVDRFKLINAGVGHECGDQILITIADATLAALGPGQTAARFDGDAFAIVAPRLTSAAHALEVVGALRTRLNDGLTVATDIYRPTISVGIAIAKAGDTAIGVLQDAETAMYRAKDEGRDRISWFDPLLHEAAISAFALERDLRDAIANDQLHLEFQPVLDLRTGAITSCEALVRWQHPVHGKLGPDRFIPIAEATRLVIPLGRNVLRHALEAAAEWPQRVQVAVNLSAPELAEPDLVAFVERTLADNGMPAKRLVIEVTETAVINDPTAAACTIAELRRLGVSIVIDDFGTGYTSLSFLRDYRIDGLKIDRSFVTELEHGSTAIVDAMIRMSTALGLEVTAEGIETTAQLDVLRALGCRYIQGFLIGRPVAAAELVFQVTALGDDPMRVAGASEKATGSPPTTSLGLHRVRDLLNLNPGAAIAIVDGAKSLGDARTVLAASGIDVGTHQALRGTAAAEFVTPADTGMVSDALVEAGKRGFAVREVHLRDGRMAALHLVAIGDAPIATTFVMMIIPDSDGDVLSDALRTEPLSTADVGVLSADDSGIVTSASPTALRLLRLTRAEVMGMRVIEAVHADDYDSAVAAWLAAKETRGTPQRFRCRAARDDDGGVWMEVTITNPIAGTGPDAGSGDIRVELHDISLLVAEYNAIDAGRVLLEELTQMLPVGVAKFDSRGRIEYANARLTALFGRDPASVVASAIAGEITVLHEAFSQLLSDGTPSRFVTERGRTEFERDLEWTLRPVRSATGPIVGGVICVSDVTDAVELRAALEARATTDALTGCMNWGGTLAGLQSALASVTPGLGVGVLFIDLDGFKEINDSYGHAVGDRVLEVVAQRLRHVVRAGETIGRLGGDEFVVIAPGLLSLDATTALATRVATEVNGTAAVADIRVEVAASIGVAWAASGDAESLLAQADSAMYHVKHAL